MIQETPYQIYSLNCPVNTEQVRYIGVTKKPLSRRLREHILDRDRTHKTDWIKSLRKKELMPSINLIEDGLTVAEAFEKEMQYIKLFKSFGARLTNCSDGGEGNKGYRYTDEQKLRMSRIHKGKAGFWTGKKRSEETKQKISDKLKGVRLSEERKQNMSRERKGRKGKPHSTEAKLKMSLAKKGQRRAPLSEEHKAKISLAKKGQKPWNKDKTNVYSEETINKMKQSHKERFSAN